MGAKFEQWKASCLSPEISTFKRRATFYGLTALVFATAVLYFWCGKLIHGKVQFDPFVLAPLTIIQFIAQLAILHHQYKSHSVPAYVRTATELFVMASSLILLFFVLSASYS